MARVGLSRQKKKWGYCSEIWSGLTSLCKKCDDIITCAGSCADVRYLISLYLRSIVTLFCRLHPGLLSDRFSSSYPTTVLQAYPFFFSIIRATYHAHLIFIELITVEHLGINWANNRGTSGNTYVLQILAMQCCLLCCYFLPLSQNVLFRILLSSVIGMGLMMMMIMIIIIIIIINCRKL